MPVRGGGAGQRQIERSLQTIVVRAELHVADFAKQQGASVTELPDASVAELQVFIH
ncbi:hypothetical protein PI124_g17888 [Phytophthora idaei]|nr:hypothetical protein PI125_g18545 [Phytophthora idaei]KAG3237116.1 hypothetical protein PI124_g17888 [Phytophthora idaei]